MRKTRKSIMLILQHVDEMCDEVSVFTIHVCFNVGTPVLWCFTVGCLLTWLNLVKELKELVYT